MNSMRLTIRVFALSLTCLVCSSMAQAQATRTWVSGVGDDANPCSRTAPCKTFAGAISKTAPCGEISVLDPGGFGAVTIGKSLTINGDGTLAGILSAGANAAIIVNAQPADVVTIRSVSINAGGTGVNGVRFIGGKHLNIENCSITNFTGNGIDVSLGATGTSNLAVKKTTITGNCSGGPIGIRVTTTGNTFKGSIDETYLQGLATGLDVLAGTATISRSVITNNSNFGIIAEGTGKINADTCILTANNVAVSAQAAGTTIRLGNNSITGNTTGITAIGSVFTFGDNRNADTGAPNQPVTTKQ